MSLVQGAVVEAVRALQGVENNPVGGTGGSRRYGRALAQVRTSFRAEGGTPEGPAESRACGSPPRLISCERCFTTHASTTALYSTAVLGDR